MITIFRFHCSNCGASVFFRKMGCCGEVAYGTDDMAYRRWAREMQAPIKEQTREIKGMCAKCYDGRSDEDVKLINGLDVYARNVKNIENEGYRQPESRKKHIIYQRKIREAIMQWQARTVFMPAPLLEDGTFFVEEFVTGEGLEDRLEY
jgi:hypothetical protein